MKVVVALIVCALVCANAKDDKFAPPSIKDLKKAPDLKEHEYRSYFKQFKEYFDRTYADNSTEGTVHYNAFKENLDKIRAYNAADLPFKLGVNQYTDIPINMFADQMLKMKPRQKSFWRPTQNAFMKLDEEDAGSIPESIDWYEKGAVTPAKDQGACGSWYFLCASAPP